VPKKADENSEADAYEQHHQADSKAEKKLAGRFH